MVFQICYFMNSLIGCSGFFSCGSVSACMKECRKFNRKNCSLPGFTIHSNFTPIQSYHILYDRETQAMPFGLRCHCVLYPIKLVENALLRFRWYALAFVSNSYFHLIFSGSHTNINLFLFAAVFDAVFDEVPEDDIKMIPVNHNKWQILLVRSPKCKPFTFNEITVVYYVLFGKQVGFIGSLLGKLFGGGDSPGDVQQFVYPCRKTDSFIIALPTGTF